MGRHFDSSITRVRPFFQWLLRRDATGATWLPALLRLAPANPAVGAALAGEAGPLQSWVAQNRPERYSDRVLRSYGIPVIDLQSCFECRVPPPARFLRWLIWNPNKMVWPRDAEMADATRAKREALFNDHGPERQQAAVAEAIAELDRHGAEGSDRKWWAFEGFSWIDCYLETDDLIVLIEGKRTEPLSPSTLWFPDRGQLLRNLEVAQAEAQGKAKKHYAVMVMAEEDIGPVTPEAAASLPHLTGGEQDELLSHYLGCVTWSRALFATFFPHTVADVAADLVAAAAGDRPTR